MDAYLKTGLVRVNLAGATFDLHENLTGVVEQRKVQFAKVLSWVRRNDVVKAVENRFSALFNVGATHFLFKTQ